MKIFISIIFAFFICVSLSADTTLTGALYNATTLGVAKIVNGSLGLSRSSCRITMTPSGDLLFNYVRGGTSLGMIIKTANWGGTWAKDSNTFAGEYNASTWYTSADTSIWMRSSAIGGAGDTMVTVRYVHTTRGNVDKVSSYLNTSSGGRPGMTKIGALPIYTNVTEDGTTDSTIVYMGDGTTTPITWSRMWAATSATRWPLAFKVPFEWTGGVKGGIAWWNSALDRILWTDTVRGDTISADFWPGNTGQLYANEITYMISVGDSHFVGAFQINVTAGQDSLVTRAGYINSSSLGGGSGSVTLGSAVKIAHHDVIKTGHYSNPVLSWLYNTDTVLLSLKSWPDTTRAAAGAIGDSVDIMTYISGDKGVTWSFLDTLLAAAVNRKVWELQAPKVIYNINDTIRYPLIWRDSVTGTASDTISAYLANLVVKPTEAAAASVSKNRRMSNVTRNIK